jgi:hypothetical protein
MQGDWARRAWRVVLTVAVGLTLPAVVPGLSGASEAVLFSDGFESGGFGAWTSTVAASGGSVTTVTDPVSTGVFSGRLAATTAAGSVAYARSTLVQPLTQGRAAGRFRVEAEGTTGSNVPLLRLFSADGTRLVSLHRQNGTGGQLWLQVAGTGFTAMAGTLPLGTWTQVEVDVVAAGPGASSLTVRQDSRVIGQVTAASLPAAGAAAVQIGQEVKGQAFALVADDVTVTGASPGTTTTTATSTTTTTTTDPSTTTTTTTTDPTTTTTTTTDPTTTTTTTTDPTTTTTTTTTPPADEIVFSDGFESGTLSAWTTTNSAGGGTAAAVSEPVHGGAHAARFSATSDGSSFASARTTLSRRLIDGSVAGHFRVVSEGPAGSNVPLLRLFDPDGKRAVSLYRQNATGGRLWMQHSGTTFSPTSGILPLDTWGQFEVRFGAATIVVRQNGQEIFKTTAASMPAAGIAAVQLGQDVKGQPFTAVADDIVVTSSAAGSISPPTTTSSTSTTTTTATTTTTTAGPASPPAPAGERLLIADHRNRRLLITDFDGLLIWKWDNPTGRADGSSGPLGVRWVGTNQILATFGTGEVGLIDVATKKFVWKTAGYNNDWFQSPYEAELLPDGNVAVAMRFNDGGRVDVYNPKTGELVWRHKLNQAHAVKYRSAAESYNSELPTLLIGGWGATKEVVYAPAAGETGQTVTSTVKTEFTHAAIVAPGSDDLLTTEGYYVQRIRRDGTPVWRQYVPLNEATPEPNDRLFEELRRVAVNPHGGLIYTGAEADRIEFRTDRGEFVRAWSRLSDGSTVDYPYGIQVISYAG